MRRAMLAMLLACGCGAADVRPAAAPDFELRTPEGERVQGAALWSAKPVLLVFMTAW